MKEAVKRNPDIILGALAWTAPHWIGDGNYCSQDNVNYTVTWLIGARDIHKVNVSFIGAWNERPVLSSYIPMLRKGLNDNGFSYIKIVAGA